MSRPDPEDAFMNRLNRWPLHLALLCLVLRSAPVVAQERPITGKKVPGLEALDKAILDFMDTINCQAATVAFSRDGRLLYSRGYGWLDKDKKKPVPPDALMRIASVSKPITAVAIKNAIRSRQLSLEAKAFKLIAVKAPGGQPADPRINSITIGQLLEHKGGWDSKQALDPMFRTKQIEQALNLKGPTSPVDVVAYMLTQPLQFNPGEKTAYSNFGYCVLGRVLEKVMKKPYIQCVQQSVCKPLGITDIKLGSSDSAKRDRREVWYPVADDAFSLEVMDAHGGLIASAPALCRFLQAYWINGEPRLPGQHGDWTFFGSLPGTTAMVRQREDGINVAVLLNGRRGNHFNEDDESLKKVVDRAIDKALKKP
jgi:CubicO group peptidase (beta-lactamase class C family)